MSLHPNAIRRANKYRRAFEWRVSEDMDVPRQVAGLIRLATGDFPDILEDFLRVSRTRIKNLTAMFQLQLNMLHNLHVQDQAIRSYKEAKEEKSSNQDWLSSQIFMHRLIANALRTIGDGIAWRALDFDRSVPRVLSANPVKNVILTDGLIAELNTWTMSFEEGRALAIMNTLTNCLALGDITIVNDDHSVEVVEVKAGSTKSRRKVKQKSRLKSAIELLNGSGAIEGKPVQIRTLPITPRNHLGSLKELLKDAHRTGSASTFIEDWLFVDCIDLGGQGGRDIAVEHEQVQRRMSSWDDSTISFTSRQAMTFSPNIAPFSVFPFSERTCVDLMIGQKMYTAHLNISRLITQIERRGWKVAEPLDLREATGIEEAMFILRKGRFHFSVPPALLMSMMVELLSVDTLLAQAEAMRAAGPQHTDKQYVLSLMEGEFAQWL